MTPEILKEIEKVADDPVAAEKLCGKRGVEFHPLACDLVEAAKDKDTFCRHVTKAVRDERQEQYDILYKAEHPRSRAKRAKVDIPPPEEAPFEPTSIAAPPETPPPPSETEAPASLAKEEVVAKEESAPATPPSSRAKRK